MEKGNSQVGKDNLESKTITTDFTFKMPNKKKNNCGIVFEDLCINSKYVVSEKSIGANRIIIKRNNIDINNETRIARYINLESLIDILFYSRLYVPNRQRFYDLRETQGLRQLRENLPFFRNAESYNNILLWNRIERYRKKFLQTCVSCWTLGLKCDNGIDENYLMWKAYAGNKISFRIETSLGCLLDSITWLPKDILIEDVVYGTNCPTLSESEVLLFNKTIYYSQEQELRLVVLSNKGKGEYLKLDLSKLFGNQSNKFKITFSPFAPPTMYYFLLSPIKKICEKYSGLELLQSNIIECSNLTAEDNKALEIFKDYK